MKTLHLLAGAPLSMSRPETWLHPNRRILLGASTLVLLVTLAAAWLGQWFGASVVPEMLAGPAWLWSGRAVAVGGILALAFLAWQTARPRLAYHEGFLLVYLRPAAPIRVPLDAVECFLLSQGATFLEKQRLPTRTVTLVVRLAEKRTEWEHVEVHKLLGAWCGGQITIRGTWCEPLGIPLVNSLNERLAATQQELARQAGAANDPASPTLAR